MSSNDLDTRLTALEKELTALKAAQDLAFREIVLVSYQIRVTYTLPSSSYRRFVRIKVSSADGKDMLSNLTLDSSSPLDSASGYVVYIQRGKLALDCDAFYVRVVSRSAGDDPLEEGETVTLPFTVTTTSTANVEWDTIQKAAN